MIPDKPNVTNDSTYATHARGARSGFSSSSSRRGQGTSFGAHLVLDVSPIPFDDAELTVGVLPYRDSDQLRELRRAHGSTHVFRRQKRQSKDHSSDSDQSQAAPDEASSDGTEIIAAPFVENAPQIGAEFRTVRLHDELGLAAALIRSALVNYLCGLPRKVLAYSPITFLADESKENLLAKALPTDLDCPDWLMVCPLYEADVRVFHFERRPPFVGVCFNVRTKRQIACTCDKLIVEGFPLLEHYVKKQLPQGDPRIHPDFLLVGRVDSIEGEVLHLADHREDIDSILANEAYIEVAAFDAVLRHIFGDAFEQIKLKLKALTDEFRHGDTRLKRLRAIASYFQSLALEMIPGVKFRFRDFLDQSDRNAFPAVEKAPPVVYVFDATGNKTDTWRDRGVDQHGPYSTPTFTPTEPRICVVCQRAHRGQIEQFVRKFLEGISVSKATNPRYSNPPNKRQPFTKGFIRKYALKNASVEIFEADGDSALAYRKTVLKSIESQTERKARFDLALVETEERFHQLTGENNPYLVSKAEFMSHQIAVQEFEVETTAIPDYRLQYVLNNMALATYAKLGGTPWLVKANLPIAHELVFGLGSARIGEGRLGESERVVGITTVFTGEGNYCVSTISKAVSFLDYEGELLDSLKTTVHRLSKSRNWQPKDHVRLIFHAFKPFKHSEEEAVKKLMQSLGDYNVDFAFLHVIEDHPFQLFDVQQNGVPANDGTGGLKGKYAPERGGYMRLSGYESLITLTGPTDLKQSSDGMPRPVLLRLGRGSTFTDMTYLTRQVNTFACHSWRSFFPSPLPVTVKYSELIARVLGDLATVPYWNPSLMLGSIRETCWFL